MIRIKVLIFALLFALLGSPIAAIASDITGALYFGTVIVSNNSTASTNVATTGNISTTNLIAGQYLNSTANNCVVQNSSGADVRFQPGYTDANLWCFWVPSIGADSYLTYILYTANSTGGEIRYFPGAGGMTTSDDVTMEWGDDFESAFTTVLTDTTGNLQLLKKRYSANIQNWESGLLAGMYFFEPVDVTPNIQVAWTDVDVSRYIPAGATGVILELDENGSVTGFRKNGSTDDRRIGMEHNWVMVGVDADLIFEAYMSAGGIIYLIGYTDDNWTYFTNAVDVSLGGVGVWTDIDVSASAPNAAAAIIDIYNTGGAQSVALRKKGSADNRYDNMNNTRHYFNVVGLDDAQIFQGQIQNLLIDFFLVGYCTVGGAFDTNLPDKSLAGAGVWLPIDCSAEAPGADFLLFEVFEVAGGALTFGFRANGSASTVIQMKTGHSLAVVPCDDNQIVEGWVQGLGVDFFLIGGITSGAEQPYQTHALAAAVSVAEHDVEVAIEAEPDMSLWASDVTVSVSMGQGILPVRLLQEQTLIAPAASVTFSSITGNVSLWDSLAGVTSRHLVVMVNAKSPDATPDRSVYMRFNGDSGNNYNYQRLYGLAAAPGADVTSGTSAGWAASIPGATLAADAFGGGTIVIPHAFNTTNHKSTISLTGSAERWVFSVANRWADTAAITSVLLSPSAGNFDTGSTFLLGVVDERYLVEEQLLAGAGTIDFNNITGTGHDLAVIGYSQSDAAAVEDEIIHEINGDAHAAPYPSQELTGRAGARAAAQPNNEIGTTSGDNAPANEFGALLAFYSQYAEITNQPHFTSLSGYHESTGPTSEVRAMSGRWPTVNAITRLEYYPTAAPNQFLPGTLFSLYRVPRYVIDRQELTVGVATITFANIPQNYQALQLNVYARSNKAAVLDEDVVITLNTDGAFANFDNQELEGTGAGPPTATRIQNLVGSRVIMLIPAAGELANEFSGGIVTFNQYSTTIGHKHFLTLSGTNENQVILRSSRWENTAAIIQIDLDLAGANNFIAGSVFELVGLMPTEVFDITVDSEVKGLADGNFSAEANAEDWIAGGFGTPYFERYEHTKDGVQHQDIIWRYGDVFYDRSYYGLDFDGADDTLIVPHDANQLLTTGGTIEAWIKADTGGENNTGKIVDKSTGTSGQNGFTFYIAGVPNKVVVIINSGVSVDSVNGSVVDGDGNWYYVVATWDNTGFVTIYVNSVQSGTPFISADPVGITTGNDLTIGNRSGATDRTFDGIIDEVRVYNRVLALPEIVANYNSGVGLYTPTDTTGLIGLWHMEAGSGLTAFDSSDSGNDGVLTNGPLWVNGHVPLPYTETGTNPATPTFRAASSDPDVSANMTSFQPVSEATAPAYALGPVSPFIESTANITGNFTTVPPIGTFPLAGVIAAVANATATPPQLPLLIIACFVILAASLTTSYTLRRFGSGTLIVKSLVIIGLMGIFIALGDFGIDFWMLFIFAVLATAIAMMSRQITWR